jgi:DNA-nicking Smr family endonuclease
LDKYMIKFTRKGKQYRLDSFMNDPDSLLKYNPFEALGKLLKDKAVLRPVPIIKPGIVLTGHYQKPDVPVKIKVTEPAEICATSVNEESAFREAMEGVKPMVKDKRHEKKNNVAHNPLDHLVNEPEQDVIQHLDNLLKYGEGFIISKTPEYMEGIGRDIPPEFAERLHRGDFSIQAHIDLHGMGAVQAKDAFENFLSEAIMSGKRAVLIIHGRGISSPGEPVLKNKVSEWLTRSHWRKWVIVFTSAQSNDGGAGATYVLLRHRLTSKRPRKRLTEK